MGQKLTDILAALFAGGVTTVLLALIAGVGSLGLVACLLAGGAVGYLAYRPRAVLDAARRHASEFVRAWWKWTTSPLTLFVWISGFVTLWPFVVVAFYVGMYPSDDTEWTEVGLAGYRLIIAAIVTILTWYFGVMCLIEPFGRARQNAPDSITNSLVYREIRDAQSVTGLKNETTFSGAGSMAWYLCIRPALRFWFVDVSFLYPVTLVASLVRFAFAVYRTVHRQARVMCMVDGPLGGAATYALGQAFFAGELAAAPIIAQLAVVLLGGFAGMAVGYANLRLVEHFWPGTEAAAS